MTGLTIGELLADPDAFGIAIGCAREAWAVARARDIALGFDDVERYVRDFGAKIPGARPSMLLDLLAARATEIDAINGAIPDAARTAGLEAPYNEVVSAWVRARERMLGCR